MTDEKQLDPNQPPVGAENSAAREADPAPAPPASSASPSHSDSASMHATQPHPPEPASTEQPGAAEPQAAADLTAPMVVPPEMAPEAVPSQPVMAASGCATGGAEQPQAEGFSLVESHEEDVATEQALAEVGGPPAAPTPPEPEPASPAPPAPEKPRDPPKFEWYILKVASNREESIKNALLRKARIAGLDYYFGEVIVPTETITEYKNNKRRTKKQKIWPGYLIVQMELNDETWFLVRETPGIGDFTGSADRAAGERPAPMLPQEVEKILAKCRPKKPEEAAGEEPRRPKIELNVGDHVKIIEGNLVNFDGPIEKIDHSSGNVTVMITIFGRTTPVEVKGWQLEKA